MKEQVNINHEFIAYLNEMVLDLITNKIEDSPEKMPKFIAVNEMLNKINYDGSVELSKILGDELIEVVLEELKSNLKNLKVICKGGMILCILLRRQIMSEN